MCTGIKVNYKNGCVIGRTMDYEVPLKYNAIYLPKNYNYCSDLMGNPLYSKYKALGMCFENWDPLKDGVNEHGLAGITNMFRAFNLYAGKIKPGKINISSLNYFSYALLNYKSVGELVEDLPNIHISTKDYKKANIMSPSFHFMFTDSTKRCVVIEPKGGKLRCYQNPYDVITNSPGFESHVRRLKRLLDPDNLEDFNPAKDLPGGYDPFSRFAKAFYLTKMNVKSNDFREALANFYNIMSAMVMPEGFVRNRKYNHTTHTRYICSYDTKNKLLTVKSHTNPMVYELGFEDISDDDRRQAFFVNQKFAAEKLR